MEMQKERKFSIASRSIRRKPTFWEKVKRLIFFPFSFYKRKKKTLYRIAAFNATLHLIETKAYLSSQMFISLHVNPALLDSFKKFHSVDYSMYTGNEVFSFLKLHLLKYLGGLPRKSFLKSMLCPSYRKEEIPKILNKLYEDCDIYEIRVIQSLLCLMVWAHKSSSANNMNELYLMNTFIPLFFGQRRIKNLKKKSQKDYHLLVGRWSDVLKYLPKGTMQ
ncbi:uncharacterized protein NEMAJ01_0181 [Nematocida major]|uniref:uncharacterized protein n=1 Tax=Nematocida major TaxID=1912982 RepID=UPI002007C72A|nr:uncharacterized protein NEMAJ01_0181 [Nematocida major]KAH9385285.1 hypothetical protein NEMAJ01_0181 [Nematocida major]